MASVRMWLGVALLAAPAVALADDGGAADAGWYFPPTGVAPEPTVSPSGVALGRATIFLPSIRPMYVDSHQHAVGAGGAGGDEPTCIDLTSPTLTGTVLIDLPSHVDVRSEHIAVAPGSDTFISLWVPNLATPQRVYVYRGACGGVGEQLGTVDFPYWQRQALISDPAPLPMWSDGTVVFPGTTGLLALSTAPLADPTEFLTYASLEAPLFPPEPIPGLTATAPRGGDWRVDVMAMLPGDRLWAVVSRSFTSSATPTGYSIKYLVEVSRAGQVTVIRGPDYGVQGIVSMTYDAALDAVVLAAPTYPGAPGRQLGVISARDPAGRGLPTLPGPLYLAGDEAQLPEDGFFGTADGRVFGRLRFIDDGNGKSSWVLREFGLDFDRADFDGDGMSARVEAMLGTSDLFWDTDGDGLEDGLERFNHSDPLDAGSPSPPAPLEPVIFAPSLMPETWAVGNTAPDTGVGVGHGRLCRGVHIFANGVNSPDSYFQCVDEDGKPLAPAATPTQPYVFPLPPSFSPDGTAAFYDRLETNGTHVSHLRLDLQTGVEAPFGPYPHLERPVFSTVLSRDVVLSNPLQGYGLDRITADDEFQVIAPDRKPCPILATAADPCGPDALRVDDYRLGPSLVGPWRGGALYWLGTLYGDSLLRVTEDRVDRVVNAVHVGNGSRPTALRAIPSGGHLLVTGDPVGAVDLVDDDLRVVPVRQPRTELTSNGLSQWFKHGFIARQTEEVLIEPQPSQADPCMCADGVCNCDVEPPAVPSYHAFSYATEWVPLRARVEPGEVLFFAAGRLNGLLGAYRDPASATDPEDGRHWALWRATPVGAVGEWLDEDQFHAGVTDAAAKASLATTRLGDVTSLSVAPDGLHVCAVEVAADRVWELSLNPSTRAFAGAALVKSGAHARACAYDEQGALALVLSASPAETAVVVGGRSIALADMDQPDGLLRVDGLWMVHGHGEGTRCAYDDGHSTIVQATWVAMSAAPGGVAFVDARGKAQAGRAAELCTGAPGVETLTATGNSLWVDAYTRFTFRTTTVTAASMAVRPDGTALFAALDPVTNVRMPAGPNYLFRIEPAYVPRTVGERMVQLDPFRRTDAQLTVAALLPSGIEAMALVPGADASGDWGRLGPRAPPVVVTPPDAGPVAAADGGPSGAGNAPKQGCGCGSDGLDLGVLGLALGLLRRRGVR